MYATQTRDDRQALLNLIQENIIALAKLRMKYNVAMQGTELTLARKTTSKAIHKTLDNKI